PTCAINATVRLLPHRTYQGDSRTGTALRQVDGANLPALVASSSWTDNRADTDGPIRIAHLTLDGSSASNSATSVLVLRSWLTVVEDVVVSNAPADGIQLTSLSQNNTPLANTQVNGRISNSFVTNSRQFGVHIVDTQNSVTDWDLVDNWISNS